jgi:hypothetical protein
MELDAFVGDDAASRSFLVVVLDDDVVLLSLCCLKVLVTHGTALCL